MAYVEKRTLSAESVRSLCISKSWYTGGTVEEYDKLLNKLYDLEDEDANITADILAEVAQDILEHSSTDTPYNIESVMWELNRAANTFFYWES